MIDTFPNRSEVDFTQIFGRKASRIEEFLCARHCPHGPKAGRVAGAFTDYCSQYAPLSGIGNFRAASQSNEAGKAVP
jgi:hypothetical protein